MRYMLVEVAAGVLTDEDWADVKDRIENAADGIVGDVVEARGEAGGDPPPSDAEARPTPPAVGWTDNLPKTFAWRGTDLDVGVQMYGPVRMVYVNDDDGASHIGETLEDAVLAFERSRQ